MASRIEVVYAVDDLYGAVGVEGVRSHGMRVLRGLGSSMNTRTGAHETPTRTPPGATRVVSRRGTAVVFNAVARAAEERKQKAGIAVERWRGSGRRA